MAFSEYQSLLKKLLPENERGDVIKNYHKHITIGDKRVKYAKMWTKWEAATSYLSINENTLRTIDENKGDTMWYVPLKMLSNFL